MASVNITIPDQHVSRVVHALCTSGGFAEENAANAKQALLQHIKAVVKAVESNEAAAAITEPDTTGVVE